MYYAISEISLSNTSRDLLHFNIQHSQNGAGVEEVLNITVPEDVVTWPLHHDTIIQLSWRW